MHKKPFVAVMIFGLLLLTHSVGFAAKGDPFKPHKVDVQLLPRIARGLVKDPLQAPVPLTGTSTNIQMGVSRGGATLCSGDGYGGVLAYYDGWYFGDEFYASYQDPENFGTCAGGTGLYTFDVTDVTWWIYDLTDTYVWDFQPLVFDDAGGIGCAVPGVTPICAGPLYTVDFPAAGGYLLGLPLPTECCVYGPYFAGIYAPTVTGTNELGIVVDNDGPTDCAMYNDYGGGWLDLSVDVGFVGDIFLWSDGVAYDQNACPGTPGICDWQSWNAGAAYIWNDPRSFGQSHYFTRFNADVSCTLMEARFLVYCGTSVGSPTVEVAVYGNNGPTYAGRQYPDCFGCPPGSGTNFLGSVDVPFANLTCYPDWTTVDLTSLGPLVFGPAEEFFVATGRSPNTPDLANDVVTFMSDDEFGSVGRSGFWSLAYNEWYYFTEYYAPPADFEMVTEVKLCCEQVDLVEVDCAAAGPDDWSTWAHDYNRTSASTIALGDPCLVTAAWYEDLDYPLNPASEGPNSFNEPVVAGDIVYISTDNILHTLDLSTGAPGNTITGLPYMFGSNRGNVTVEGGNVYVTAGGGLGISKWDAALTTAAWVRSAGAPPSLNARNRFGTTAVYTVGADEIVVICDEGGEVTAINTATGANYAGWAVNPLTLDAPIYHSPAFDGTDLYISTGGLSSIPGSVYRIDAATGVTVWNAANVSFPDEGYPAGVSLEGSDVYTISRDGSDGRRIKLAKLDGSEAWGIGNGAALYGPPTIGRNFIYCPQDGNGSGVLIVDKSSGAALYNFAADGVGRVTQHTTLTCDNYLFAGDRSGNWWLLDVNAQTAAWSIAMPYGTIVNGTALATHSDGTNYAVVGLRTGGINAWAACGAWKFNGPTRPRLQQAVTSVDINVDFGTGAGNLYTEPDVFSNAGCIDLNFTGYNVLDPAPDVAARTYRDALSRRASAVASMQVGADWTTYFENTKKGKLASLPLSPANDELSVSDVAIENAVAAMRNSNRSSSRLAAGAAIVRTSAPAADNTPLAPLASTSVSWTWDGTALERGVDLEIIEFITDDPDFPIIGLNPTLEITYIGGCLPDEVDLTWNTGGTDSRSTVYNTGKMGNSSGNALTWQGEDDNIYEGGFFVAGDSGLAGVQWHLGDLYGSYPRLFLPNPRPSDGLCGFDGAADVVMGFIRDGGCPGTPIAVNGAWARSSYVDTNEAQAGTPLAAIGLVITQTEVGAYDPLYGDFKLIEYKLTNRDAVAKGPIYAGSWYDWDVHPSYADNHGLVSANFNGYALWDQVTPNWALGVLDPSMGSSYTGVDPSTNPPHRIEEMGERNAGGSNGNYGLWQGDGVGDYAALWTNVVNYSPAYSQNNMDNHTNLLEDHAAMLVNSGQMLAANETRAVYQAIFGVDGTSNLNATIENLSTEVAVRAATWGGFARGDVNQDGIINLADVCWLGSGNQIYPDTYNGDVDISGAVDAADATYLLNYVTGLGAAPQGEWRFTF